MFRLNLLSGFHTVDIRQPSGNIIKYETQSITDFKLTIDLGPYVETWSRIICQNTTKNFEEILREYSSSLDIKSLLLNKKVECDFDALRSEIKSLIQPYLDEKKNTQISIHFNHHYEKIRIKSTSPIAELARDTGVRTFCFLTGLAIIFAPLYLLLKRRVDAKIIAYFPFDPKGFLEMNKDKIIEAVKGRRETFWVAQEKPKSSEVLNACT